MRNASVPSAGTVRAIPSRDTSFPAGLRPSNDRSFPGNPFGSGRNRMSRGVDAIGPTPARSQTQQGQTRFITHNLTIARFPDNSETYIVPGDQAMVARTIGKGDPRHVVAEVSYFNHVARSEYHKGRAAILDKDASRTIDRSERGANYEMPVTAGRGGRTPGAIQRSTPTSDLQSLKSYREVGALYGQEEYIPTIRVLQNWNEYEKRGLDRVPTETEVVTEYMNQLPANQNNRAGEVQAALKPIAEKEAARQRVVDLFRQYLDTYGVYLTMDGIMNRWNMYAPVQRCSWSKPKEDFRANSETASITFTLRRYAQLLNRWSNNVRTGAILGYILKREEEPGKYGEPGYKEFARVPYYSNERRMPAAGDLMFRNIDGLIEFGQFYPVGTADNLLKHGHNDKICRQAMALDDTPYAEAREKIGMLNKIQVLVGERIQ